jgi:transcriptional regulator with XRE-family HTH domain
MKASTCDLASLGARIRAAREAAGLSRPAFVEKFGGSVRTLENNEGGRNEPGACLIASFASLGINTAWLLTGEGPMLLADLTAPTPAAPQPAINVDALVQAFCVTFQTAPAGETVEQSARKALAFYQYCLDQGLITPEGEGKGNLRSAV